MTTSDRWRLIEELFHEALDKTGEERADFLEGIGARDGELKRELASLLAHHDHPVDILETPALGSGFSLDVGPLPEQGRDPLIGSRVGPYRIESFIAAGGMGSVYRAVREDDLYSRTVAVKFVQPWGRPDLLQRRFEVERRTLARLEHPCIGRLHDAGITPQGLAYLIMELVEGERIDEWCDRRELDIRARLELFETVCRAVHYAHQNLIVHRDLKPNNIHVTAEGTPKLLDFGIAKVLEEEEDGGPARTVTRARMMTPEYASPEQIRGESVTIATDIYSLGVILYQLLAGASPYRLTDGRPREVEDAVREQNPKKPSTSVTDAPVTSGPHVSDITGILSAEVGRKRRTTAARLRRSLRGDLDNIVMMALRKEPERRYPSALQFADDVRRYLGGLPVIASADTFLYKSSKFIRRHRVAVSAASLVFVVSCVAAVVTSWQAHVAAAERDAARLAERRAEALAEHATIEADSAHESAEFLIDAFLFSTAGSSPRNLERAAVLIERRLDRVRRQYENHPHLRANLLDALGRVYLGLGRLDQAESVIKEARSIREEEFGRDSLEVALSFDSLGQLSYARSDFEGGAVLLARALELHRSLPREVHTDVARAANNLAVMLRGVGRLDEAEALHREALELRRREFGDRHPLVAESLNNLAAVLIDRAAYDDAEARLREALAIRREVLGPSDPLVAQTTANIASVVYGTGDLTRAVNLYEQTLELYDRLAAGGEAEQALALSGYSQVLMRLGRMTEAREALEKGLSLQLEILGPEHADVASTRVSLAELAQAQGDGEEALLQWEQGLEIRRRTLPPDHPLLATTLANYGDFLCDAGQAEEGEPLLREALDIYREVLGSEHWFTAVAEICLGKALVKLGEDDEAEELLLHGLKILKSEHGRDSSDAGAARHLLIGLYRSQGRLEAAEALRSGGQ